MAPTGTRPRENHEPASATGPLNGAYQLLLQDRCHRELKATHAFQCKENQTDRMHEVLVSMEAWDESWA